MQITKGHQDCVRRRATKSVEANSHCKVCNTASSFAENILKCRPFLFVLFVVVLCAGFSEGDCGFSLLPVLLGPIAVRTAKDLALLFFSPFKIVLVSNFKATNWLPWRYTTVLAFLDLRSVNKYQLSDECLRHPRKSIVYDE